jgi:hypothetical protein
VVGGRENTELDPLDALIDDTAQSLTEGTPSALLRASVRERIGRTWSPASAGLWWRPDSAGPRLAWAATAAAAVLVIAMLGRDDAPAPAPTAPAAPAVAAAPAVPAVDVPPAQPAVAAARRVNRAVDRRPPLNVMGDPANLRVPEGAVAVEVVEIAPLMTDTLELEQMEVPMPLRAEWVQIEPLSIE